MDFEEAVDLVFEDYTSTGETWTREAVVAHVRLTLSLEGDIPGTVALVDCEDRLSEAYQTILTTP